MAADEVVSPPTPAGCGPAEVPALEPAEPRPELAATIRERMEAIAVLCEGLSQADQAYLLAFPPDAVGAHLRRIGRVSHVLFQRSSIEICSLLAGKTVLRFSQIKDLLFGISTRTLAARLAALQGLGYVQRTFYDESPPHVEYRLTREGRRFAHLLAPVLLHLLATRSPEMERTMSQNRGKRPNSVLAAEVTLRESSSRPASSSS